MPTPRSVKSIEIRKREAEALRARIDRDLTARLEEVREKVNLGVGVLGPRALATARARRVPSRLA